MQIVVHCFIGVLVYASSYKNFLTENGQSIQTVSDKKRLHGKPENAAARWTLHVFTSSRDMSLPTHLVV